jgi:copper homeostasis protein
MPGSGVRKENIKMLAEKTGCIEFHSSLRSKTKSPMQFVHSGFAGSEESYLPADEAGMNNAINAEEVRG